MKQRFGELLALVLIVTIIGFIVYMIIPSSQNNPRTAPVTVRSTSKIVAQSHVTPVAAETVQTPINTPAIQEATAVNVRQNNQSPVSQLANKGAGNNKITISVKQNSRQGNNMLSATVKSGCTPLPKTITKAGSELQAMPLISGLLSGVTYCAS